MVLYLVGQIIEDNYKWGFQGIFDSEQLAIDACRNYRYFYIKVKLNENLPDENSEMSDITFPIRR